jgi:hypothetical protein
MVRKRISWNLGKNTKLKEERGVSFEEVEWCLLRNAFRLGLVSSRSHRHQPCFHVTLKGKRWVVPYREYKSHIYDFSEGVRA